MSANSIKVWRYMSLGRFVWMLKKKALWMCRADQLDDAWEMAYSNEEFKLAVETSGLASKPYETEVLTRVLHENIRKLRERTFVSCWTASNSESHAMWSVYCGSSEGVAVQTTLQKLKASVGELSVRPVRYEKFNRSDLTALDLVTRKQASQ